MQSVFSPAARPRRGGWARTLTRAGGLKTRWTKPQGTAVPQLWGLQHGERLRRIEKATAKAGERKRAYCGVIQARDHRLGHAESIRQPFSCLAGMSPKLEQAAGTFSGDYSAVVCLALAPKCRFLG